VLVKQGYQVARADLGKQQLADLEEHA